MTEEYLDLLLRELKEDQDFKAEPEKLDESEFKDKYPFNLEVVPP